MPWLQAGIIDTAAARSYKGETMKKLSLFAGITLAVAGTATADTLLEYRNTSDNAVSMTMKIADGRIAMKDHSQQEHMLFTTTDRRMYIINPRKREYAVMDEAAMEELAGTMNSAMAEMEKQLADMPPAQREQMKKMMGGMMDAGKKMLEPKITRSGRTGSYAGYDCEYVTMTIPNISESEMCVTDIGDIDMPGSDRATLEAMQDHMKMMSEKMSETLGMNIPFNQIEGFPVFIRDEESPKGRVVNISDANFDAAEMQVPEGYRETRMEGPGS